MKKKKAAAILTAGGKHNEKNVYHHLRAFFKMTGAIQQVGEQRDFTSDEFTKHIVCSVDTDILSAGQDEKALIGVRDLAEWLND